MVYLTKVILKREYIVAAPVEELAESINIIEGESFKIITKPKNNTNKLRK